jgi:hypothetical protein
LTHETEAFVDCATFGEGVPPAQFKSVDLRSSGSWLRVQFFQ